jgi:hypothetical protein
LYRPTTSPFPRFWASDEDVIRQTLELFIELTTFGNGKMLLSLEAVNYILAHHTVRAPRLSVGLRLATYLLTLSVFAFVQTRSLVSRRCERCSVSHTCPCMGYPPPPADFSLTQAEHFAFLNGTGSGPYRTLFYGTLARLLYLEDTSERFEVGFDAGVQGCRGGNFKLCVTGVPC